MFVRLFSFPCLVHDGCHDGKMATLLNFKSSLTDPLNDLSSFMARSKLLQLAWYFVVQTCCML